MDEIDELLSIRAAELYYEENKTQDEIGQALRLTRWKVGRLLAQAKQQGFIRIEILHPRARRLPIERRLRDERGLTPPLICTTLTCEAQPLRRCCEISKSVRPQLTPSVRGTGRRDVR